MDASNTDGGNPVIPAVKLVVYLDDWSGSYGSWATRIDFTKMTHLNLAFVEATGNNDWQFVDGQSDGDVKALVAAAHAAGVKVIASLGGGGTDSTVVNQYSNPANDDALVANADAFLNRLDLDGADIDVEKESTGEVGDNYGMFVSKLIATLHPEGKLVTAAVAQYLQPYMNDDTLHSFDFVNIMTYSGNVGDYMNDVGFYTGQKNMDPTKLTLGIISESGQHTSVQTTQAITQLSKNYGGVMLWDLGGDTTDQSSVYQAIQGSL
jgi:GH18 family chitinase